MSTFPNNAGGYTRRTPKPRVYAMTAKDRFFRLVGMFASMAVPFMVHGSPTKKPKTTMKRRILGKVCTIKISNWKSVVASHSRYRPADLSHGWRSRTLPAAIAQFEKAYFPKAA